MDAAYEQSMDAAVEFIEMRGVFLATGVSGLFHLFEKQMYVHLNKELAGWLSKPINQWRDIESIIPKFMNEFDSTEENTKLADAFNDKDLLELKLAANAIKHGIGSSYDNLVKANASVVSQSRLEDEWSISPYSILGIAISISPEDIRRYRDSILRFWKTEGEFWAHRTKFHS
jgi:hypothetical protein